MNSALRSCGRSLSDRAKAKPLRSVDILLNEIEELREATLASPAPITEETAERIADQRDLRRDVR